ncbi:MAG: type II toxin-antitoxin system RelE/ParE family toxin [Bauldia sp.]
MRVRFSWRAKRDLASILTTMAADSPRAAIAFDEAVIAVAERVALFPGIGRVHNADPDVRSVAMPRWGYLLFYVEAPSEVVIVTIRSGRQQPLFEQRWRES